MNGRAAIAQAMSERELDDSIRSTCDELGLLRYHTFNSMKSPSGFPDLVIAGQSGVLFRELKREDKNPTPAQQKWLDTLVTSGQDAGVWRPSSLLSGQVARELATIAGLPVQPVQVPRKTTAVSAAGGEGPAGTAVTTTSPGGES